MRFFEKISKEEFKKHFDESLYDGYTLPKRATKNSAGYDFFAINDYTIKPGEIIKLPTGYKAAFNNDEVLMIFVRSSMGFKWNVRLTNQVGIVESDYYNNIDNEGHIFVSLQNEGDKDYVIKKNTAYCQAVFMKFLVTDDDKTDNIRVGGIGSTNNLERGNE